LGTSNTKEKLKITIIDNSYFVAQNYSNKLTTKELLVSASQLEDQSTVAKAQKQVTQNTEIVAQSGVVFGFVGSILSGGGMSLLWTMINTLQVIEFLPLLNVNLPSFSLEVFKLLSISHFDFLPFDIIFDEFNVTDYTSPYTYNFEVVGYESREVIQNLIDIVTLSFIFVVLILAYGLSKMLFKRYKMGRWSGKQFSKWKYNNTITFMKETYLPITIFALVNLKLYSKPEFIFEYLNLILSIVYLGLYQAFFAISVWVLVKKRY